MKPFENWINIRVNLRDVLTVKKSYTLFALFTPKCEEKLRLTPKICNFFTIFENNT